MKKLTSIVVLITLLIGFQSCKKEDDSVANMSSSSGGATLTLTINGQSEPFPMSSPDWNVINDGNCISWSSGGSFVDYIDIGNFNNGHFTLWVGDNPVTNMTYKCEQDAQEFCSTPRIEIYSGGDLEDKLESIYNEPIFRLEAQGKTDCTVSNLTSNSISMNWAGKIEVLGFSSNVLGVHNATFIATNVPVDDVR